MWVYFGSWDIWTPQAADLSRFNRDNTQRQSVFWQKILVSDDKMLSVRTLNMKDDDFIWLEKLVLGPERVKRRNSDVLHVSAAVKTQ